MKLAIVIVNWNTGKLLARCLAALDALAEKDIISQVVVVDNGSSDESLSLAQQRYDIPTHFLPLGKNTGFAKANNIGIEHIRQNAAALPHILLLNPDTQVRPGALLAMLNVLERRPQTGIVGPKLIEPGESIQPSVRRFPNILTFILIFLKLGRLWQKQSAAFSYDHETIVDQVMGAAFLIRSELLMDIGTLDEAYWIWFEEVDFCKRASDKGWEVIFTPHAAVLHHGAVSFNQLVGLKRSLPFLNSSLVYARKHLGWGAYILLLFLYPVALLLTIPASLMHIASKKKNKSRL